MSTSSTKSENTPMHVTRYRGLVDDASKHGVGDLTRHSKLYEDLRGLGQGNQPQTSPTPSLELPAWPFSVAVFRAAGPQVDSWKHANEDGGAACMCLFDLI